MIPPRDVVTGIVMRLHSEISAKVLSKILLPHFPTLSVLYVQWGAIMFPSPHPFCAKRIFVMHGAIFARQIGMSNVTFTLFPYLRGSATELNRTVSMSRPPPHARVSLSSRHWSNLRTDKIPRPPERIMSAVKYTGTMLKCSLRRSSAPLVYIRICIRQDFSGILWRKNAAADIDRFFKECRAKDIDSAEPCLGTVLSSG